MTILKLACVGDLIVALYDDGHLRVWQATVCFSSQHSPSLVPSFLQIFLGQGIQGMQSAQKRVVGYSRQALFGVDLDSATFEYSLLPVHPMFTNEEEEEITCTVALNLNQLLVGSSKGNLYKYDWQTKKSSRVSKQNSQKQNSEQQKRPFLSFFKLQQIQPTKITALSHLLQHSQAKALVGYSDGSISKYNLSLSKQQANYNFNIQSYKTEEQAVVGLKLHGPTNKLYSLHQSFILMWDIIKQELVYAIDIYRPADILFLRDERVVLVNQSCQLTHVQFNCAQTLVTISHSSEVARSATLIRYQGKEYIVVGGNNGLVDVFSVERQIAVCFASNEH